MRVVVSGALALVVWQAIASSGATTSFHNEELSAAGTSCDLRAVERAKEEFDRLVAFRRFAPTLVSDEAVSAASVVFVLQAEACFSELYGPPTEFIDEGPVWMDADTTFSLFQTKWGAGSPYSASGNDNRGPRLPAGTVTYSFMGDGVSMAGDPSGSSTSVALGSLPTYQPCFLTEVANAFAAWSAVANIQFVQVPDNGVVFNGSGAAGDIRIAAHTFDGVSKVLAHGFAPPPNGSTAAGDIHFDSAENWSCTAGTGIDIGIVAMHEIGHALGLGHESRPARRALMNPTYNPSVASALLGDDVNGALSIYGSSTGATDDLVISFGSGHGLWRLDYGIGWTAVHMLSPEQVVSADIDGSGVDDLAIDFGAAHGLWVWMNRASWVQLHGSSPTLMTAGDLDGDGLDDVIAQFAGFGIYGWFNNTTWKALHPLSCTVMTTGNIDGVGGDDLVVNFPGHGVWAYRNDASWGLINGVEATAVAAGHLDFASGVEDLLIAFPAHGLYQFNNNATWVALSGAVPRALAIGDLDTDGRDDAVVDFGGTTGIWTLSNGTTWTFVHSAPSDSLVAGDLDGNGQDEIAIDFGPGHGLWLRVNSSAWVRVHTLTPVEVIVSDLN